MTFNIRRLAVIAYANGVTFWTYKALDQSLETIKAAGFFAEAQDMLTVGDNILVASADGGSLLYVAAVDLGCVVVEPMK